MVTFPIEPTYKVRTALSSLPLSQDLPHDLIRDVSGQVAFEEESPKISALSTVTNKDIVQASSALVASHSNDFSDRRIVRQRHQGRKNERGTGLPETRLCVRIDDLLLSSQEAVRYILFHPFKRTQTIIHFPPNQGEIFDFFIHFSIEEAFRYNSSFI